MNNFSFLGTVCGTRIICWPDSCDEN
uniref:Uncharacterized protein n=1 Tax=Rhizophora mucronata TaxID=61149 RepID=A0A2P2Q0C0_RHIMU